MKTLIVRANKFATKAHEGQVRKYTGEPYIVHPREVASLVHDAEDSTDVMVAAAFLHDVVEDTDATLEDIQKEFGNNVAMLVGWLTHVSRPEDGNRAHRKEKDLQFLALSPPEAQTIKLADLISNTQSIVEHDPEFAKVYMAEKAALLDVLIDGDPYLYKRARQLVDVFLGT